MPVRVTVSVALRRRRCGGGQGQEQSRANDTPRSHGGHSCDPPVLFDFFVVVLVGAVVVVAVELVVVTVARISTSASCSAREASTVLFAVGFRAWMDCPRLNLLSTMLVFSCENGIPRLLETLTAATN
jgi:hypothetical protein